MDSELGDPRYGELLQEMELKEVAARVKEQAEPLQSWHCALLSAEQFRKYFGTEITSEIGHRQQLLKSGFHRARGSSQELLHRHFACGSSFLLGQIAAKT